MKQRMVVIYRNCFTGAVSGGDMHMSGLITWAKMNYPEWGISIVHPKDDRQNVPYPETSQVENLTYVDNVERKSIALMYLIRAIKTLRNVRPRLAQNDVAIASAHFIPDVLPIFFLKQKGLNKYVFIHHLIQDMDRPKNLNNVLANLQEKLCFQLIKRRFHGIVVVNNEVALRLKELGFRQKILVSSNFVKHSNLSDHTPEKRKINAIYCGRIVPQKRVQDFVKICEILSKKFSDFNAIIVGDGPDLSRIREIVHKKKIPITMTGYVSEQEKFHYLEHSKLFIFPSVEEGWGIAIAESLSSGTPVVAYKLPVYKTIFGKHIDTAPPYDVNELAKIAEKHLNYCYTNPSAYSRQSSILKKFAEHFSVDEVAKREWKFMTEGCAANE